MDAGVLSRGLHLRADPRFDVLQHVRDGLRSRGRRCLLAHAGGRRCNLTSSRTYETGAKQQFWDDRAEWTVSLYDIVQRNVLRADQHDERPMSPAKSPPKASKSRPPCSPIRWLEDLGQCCFHACAFRRISMCGRATRRRTWLRSSSMPAHPIVSTIGDGRSRFGGSVRHVGNRFVLPGRRHDHGRLYDGRRLCVRRHSRQGCCHGRKSKPCASRSACAI